ncbi:unnamed protein product [Schistosoma curassoni]|uniref:Reverse transcriptase domain-containing protein n=1 Tax=Schistosoma curassoni TaxID=6186 RepID=A0A183JBV8_9TREM|nr:unnamed protein product [Schistosoma curassoni]
MKCSDNVGDREDHSNSSGNEEIQLGGSPDKITQRKGRQSSRFKNRGTGAEYFKELINRPAPFNPPDIAAAHKDIPDDVTPQTIGEIRMDCLIFNSVLLKQMRDSVNVQLLNQQARFRKNRSCTHQIATARDNVGQSVGWNSSPHINFLEFEKAFHRVDKTT